MFVFLALVFGLGYVIFNVGGTIPEPASMISSRVRAEAVGPASATRKKKVRENPNDPAAKLALADALLTQNDRSDEAVPVLLEQYLDQRPRDADVVSRLGRPYMGEGAKHQQEAALAQAEVQAANPGSLFAPSDGLMAQFGTGGEATKALSSDANQRLSQQSGEAALAFQQARDLYKRQTELTPDDSSVQFACVGVRAGGRLRHRDPGLQAVHQARPRRSPCPADQAADPAAPGAEADPAAAPAARCRGGRLDSRGS